MPESLLTVKPSSKGRVAFNRTAILFHAAKIGNIPELQEQLAEIDNPNSRNCWGQTVLHVLAKRDGIDAISTILETTKIDPNALDDDGWSALHIAALRNDIAMCRMMVNNGANLFNLTFSGNCKASDLASPWTNAKSPCHEYLRSMERQFVSGRVPLFINRDIYDCNGARIAQTNTECFLVEECEKFVNNPNYTRSKMPRDIVKQSRLPTELKTPVYPNWIVQFQHRDLKILLPCTALSLAPRPNLPSRKEVVLDDILSSTRKRKLSEDIDEWKPKKFCPSSPSPSESSNNEPIDDCRRLLNRKRRRSEDFDVSKAKRPRLTSPSELAEFEKSSPNSSGRDSGKLVNRKRKHRRRIDKWEPKRPRLSLPSESFESPTFPKV